MKPTTEQIMEEGKKRGLSFPLSTREDVRVLAEIVKELSQ